MADRTSRRAAALTAEFTIRSEFKSPSVNEELPADFQTSEAVLKAGFIDRVCHRKDLNEEIGKLLSILL